MVTGTELFQSPELTKLDFCWWGWMKGEVYKRDELLARILDVAARIKKREDQLNERHAICPHDLQSALKLKMGYSNIYCEL
jgi:hypothetical protein